MVKLKSLFNVVFAAFGGILQILPTPNPRLRQGLGRYGSLRFDDRKRAKSLYPHKCGFLSRPLERGT